VTDVMAGEVEERAGRPGSHPGAPPGDHAGDGATPADDPAARVRLPHEPALDGLRGLAVAAVVAFHLDRIDGGFLGVDLFFVLSGFLITSLLVTEQRGRGAIDLGRFWVRRARRLLPALFLVAVGISVLLLVYTPEGQRAGFRGAGVATLFYAANWQAMSDSASYWDMFNQPSPFDHMWSLAIEEQFYVVWPLVAVLVLRRGRRRSETGNGPAATGRTPSRRFDLAVLALVGAAVSLLLLWVSWSPMDTNRAYFSTDTRIGPTLLGAALAVVVAGRPRRTGPTPPLLELLGLGALGWMALCTVAVDGIGPSYYHGGLASFAVATLVVIVAVTGGPADRPGVLGRVIAWRPLAWLGTVSYGVYLWHWPVIVYLTPERAHLDGLPLDLLRVAVTLGVAVLSFRFVEQPIRRGALTGAKLRHFMLGGLGVSLVAVLVATAGTAQPTFVARPRGSLLGIDNDYLQVPAEVPEGTPKLLLVGDSGPMHLGPELVEAGESNDVAVAFSSQILCSVVYADDVGRDPDGAVEEREPCPADPKDLWSDLIDEYDPDVVLYYLANAGSFDHERVDGEWVWDCDAAYDAYLDGAIGDVVDVLGQNGAEVVIATSPYVAIPEATSGQRVDCRNATYRRVAAAHPGVGIVDLNGFVGHQIDTTDVDMFGDPVHLSDEGARLVADWLIDQLVTGPNALIHSTTTTAPANPAGAAATTTLGGGG
jgi:peptidoglycan/LPS O-acetylase OafA/YrhL